ncbi:MAG: putative pyridoxal-dependent aspartate 1-decarboxylase [Deltaproteobacteria bacterium]|nr:putative pyridoxal-dependent aspartate 1-decarboxylase [Deltaproteobacteria bacterium]MBW2661101.1 putative pyridoxal-dependent aspartate 1-decarboxylase [Deltaproteobacteria bacterium]
MNRHTKTELVANWQSLMRTFIKPEDDASRLVLIKYMEQISFGLHEFLGKHVGITEEVRLKDLSSRFKNTLINKNPEKKLTDVITKIVEDIAPHAVNVASPYFIGHMTSAIPFFMVHLKTIVAALNQNVVKVETSKVVSILEKQVLAKIHRLVYRKSSDFYNKYVQNIRTTLGCFVEDGTLANITALWVARNELLAPKNSFTGVEQEGIQAACSAYNINRCVVIVSRLGHYSIKKAGGLLGIGNQNIIAVDIDADNRMDLGCLKKTIRGIKHDGAGIVAVVGIAGTTETGAIDPLAQIGDICSENRIHFHVDAAWGGPTLMSGKYSHFLKGIDAADSVTIDGHKQFYMPMTCGMVLFKDPFIMDAVKYHANYVNRFGSVDLGIKSLAGSREANSLILDSALKIMGSQGYALLIEHGIETTRMFAEEIERRDNFQLITRSDINILTYRICPFDIKQQLAEGDPEQICIINKELNKINRTVQRLQREAGKSFVSRTKLRTGSKPGKEIVVLRCVIMNPMTNIKILNEILDEQEEIFKTNFDGFVKSQKIPFSVIPAKARIQPL